MCPEHIILKLGGAWRIRTAVDGFADRRLSHSSKAPCLLFYECKDTTIYVTMQTFMYFF